MSDDYDLNAATVSVIIPSWDAGNNGNLRVLIEEVQQQSLNASEIRVVERTSPNGHARNVGVEQTSGEILVFLDDDIGLGSNEVLHTFVKYLLSFPELGIVGTSQLLPPQSSRFQRRCASQLSRSQSDIVHELTDSDMVTTQCCAMRRSVLAEVGGFHDQILRGVDPELRNRVRQAGYRVSVVPEAWHYHPMPDGLKPLVSQAWRDGTASAFARRHFPETVLFNPDGHVSTFEPRRSFPQRVLRNLGQLVRDSLSGKWIGMVYGLVYAAGYLFGSMTARKRSPQSDVSTAH